MEIKKRKLPIGIQSFEKIRNKEDKYIYVDKTYIIYDILENGSVYNFMSRPRRFGKSLLVDTFKCIYEGKKELFKGLYIEDKWNWNEINPVIKIVFGEGFIEDRNSLKKNLESIVNKLARENEIKLIEELIARRFVELIEEIYKKTGNQVVVLIDEYDKPILDLIDNLEKAKEVREELKGFYSVLKGADKYLKFVFLTGVSKFSKVSLFSGLNNLEDLTIKSKTGELCGYTHDEITNNFSEYLDGVDREKMKKWYNGFNFLGKHTVYNPFDALLFFENNRYSSYWFETATPTFLINLLKKSEDFYDIPKLETFKTGGELLGSFDIEAINVETLLFQTGYLTIDEVEDSIMGILYKLRVPNLEIKKSLNTHILTGYLGVTSMSRFIGTVEPVFNSLNSGNIGGFIKALKSVFAGISYESVKKISKYEGYYTSVVFTLLTSIGLDVIQEDNTNNGRIDLTVKLGDYIYILEFKVNKTGEKALKQIKEKKYYQKYEMENKKIFLLGINFDMNDRNINEYDVEEI